jgi:hypothetical protein
MTAFLSLVFGELRKYLRISQPTTTRLVSPNRVRSTPTAARKPFSSVWVYVLIEADVALLLCPVFVS